NDFSDPAAAAARRSSWFSGKAEGYLGGAVGWAGARARAERLVHDPSYGGGATPALRAATEASIDLTRGARGGGARNRGSHRVVGKDVTRADDHGNASATGTRQKHR